MLDQDVERSTVRLVRRRLLPLLFLLYLFSFLDRSNVSMAALQMNDSLNFSASTFGFGAGIFFLGYSLLELPSNLILVRIGARLWITRIAITWGVVACATMFVRTPLQFYCMRFLLGIAEAGFFPGAIYYMSQWFPGAHRARAHAFFMAALSVATVVGGPLGGALLSLNGVGHLSGWQWLFLVEGIPPIFLGILALTRFTENPADADWLRPQQKSWLLGSVSADQQKAVLEDASPLRVIGNPMVWMLIIPYFCYYTITLAGALWGPTLVRDALGTSTVATGLVIGGINVLGIPIFILTARISDRNEERCGLAALGLALGCVGCLGAAIFHESVLRVFSLGLLYMVTPVFLASFWCLPTKFLEGASAAAGIALINAVGASGGFFGPNIIGFFKQLTGNDTGAFFGLSGLALIGGMVCMSLRGKREFGSHRALIDVPE